MATFEGTFEEFEKFIGPATNKVVTKLGKELKKTQKSCQNNSLKENTTNSEYCGVWKSLDAAHFSHLGKDRKSLISKILKTNYVKEGNIFSVPLFKFLEKFEKAHSLLDKNLIMLCRQHHVQYDIKNRGTKNIAEDNYKEIEVSANEVEEAIRVEENMMLNNLESTHDKTAVKSAIIHRLQNIGVNKGNCTFAKQGNKKWQFDIIENKLNQDYYFIFYNSLNYTFDIGKLLQSDIEKMKVVLKSKEYETRNNEKSFSVFFDGSDYHEINSKQIFEIVYSGELELA
jgi:hypothetical protein